jgi:hypothetical protein
VWWLIVRRLLFIFWIAGFARAIAPAGLTLLAAELRETICTNRMYVRAPNAT